MLVTMLENTLPIAGPINAKTTITQIGMRIQTITTTNRTTPMMTKILLDDEAGCSVPMIESFLCDPENPS
jgi:hypothetical protein